MTYLEGWNAYYKSLDMDDTPYREDSNDFNEWIEGWLSADDNERSHEEAA